MQPMLKSGDTFRIKLQGGIRSTVLLFFGNLDYWESLDFQVIIILEETLGSGYCLPTSYGEFLHGEQSPTLEKNKLPIERLWLGANHLIWYQMSIVTESTMSDLGKRELSCS